MRDDQMMLGIDGYPGGMIALILFVLGILASPTARARSRRRSSQTPLCSIEPTRHWSRASKNPLLKG